ncbi:zinc finger protein 665-like isoform X2 [Zootermopsis nevadensis]|uniref:zinc finger protein 665-like isoform X2 n=1 Tax=Zootermopsis nevadensis TaxID=136037 RepID=UPI000B8ED98A|nr:zinc finger protein 665-like isoform X2 [Zootermopsis nevadensis]
MESTRPADEHHVEEAEQKQGESSQEEEDQSAVIRGDRRELLATKGDSDVCVTLNEETLFSAHGLDLSLPLLCDFCPRKFNDFSSFDAHMVTHKECRFFSCQLCSNTYVSWGNLVAHRKACHQGQVLSCDVCGQRKYHPGLGPVNFPVGDSPVGCEECGEGFTTIMQLYRHYRVHGTHQFMPHKGKLAKVPERAAKGAVDQLLVMPSSDSCHVCSTEFRNHKHVADDMAKLNDDHTRCACRSCHSEFCNAHSSVERKCPQPASTPHCHTCVVCGKVMQNLASFQQHCTTHSGECHYNCDRCLKTFSFTSSREHPKYCQPLINDYHCQNCDQEFSEWCGMTEHVEKKHASSNEMLTCSICGQSWLSGKEFLLHYQACLTEKQTENTARHRLDTTCSVCHKVFSQPFALRRHLKLHGPLSHCRISSSCGDHQDQVLVQQHHKAAFPGNYKELQHSSECKQRYRTSMSRKSFICEYCGREFKKKLNLQLHVRRHTGERPYSCQLCGKAFYTNQQLAIHIRHHTGERPYACSKCPKAFTGPTALYVHRKLHDKVKRYLCPHCGKRFFWRSAFVGHIRLHTGERPYRCSICSKSFTLKGKLNLHLKKHALEDTLACSDCGEKFGSEAELNAHRSEQCSVTLVTFVEEGPSGERDTRIIIVNTEDLKQNNIYIDDDKVVQLVV